AYEYLEGAGRSELAWEWLRRDPDYRQARVSPRHRSPDGLTVMEAASEDDEARWGCLHIEEARRRSTDVPVRWSAKVDRSALRVAALAPSIGETAFDLGRWT